jgi:ABC-type multidrug transport system fused ATPase/permease subunit
MRKINTLKLVAIYGIILFIAQVLLLRFDVYGSLWWSDIPMHILGGMWVALIFKYLFLEKNNTSVKINGFWANLILCLGFVVLIGVLWEFYEFFVDSILFAQYQQTLADTMKDLLDDMIGGAIVSAYYLIKK